MILFPDDITIDESAEFWWTRQWLAGSPATPVDMSAVNITASLMIRGLFSDISPIITLSRNAGITLDASGNTTWGLTTAQLSTAVTGLTTGFGFWDLIITFVTAPPQIVPAQKVFKFGGGAVRVNRSATH